MIILQLSPAHASGAFNANTGSSKLQPQGPDKGIRFEDPISFRISQNELRLFPQMGSLKPIKLEASYTKPISLREALLYALDNNLPIKISHESWQFQRYQLYATMGQFLPTNSLLAGFSRSNVYTTGTINIARSYQETISFPVFQGGLVYLSALSQYYRTGAFRHAYNSTVNDALLSVYKNYTFLQFNSALLKIRANAVAASEEQLRVNQELFKAGKGTRLSILQSQAQLAEDKDALLEQQYEYRRAALILAHGLNLPLSINLIPAEDSIGEISLLDEKLTLNEFINTALNKRPELRQFECFRLAAARTTDAAASTYYPSLNFFLSFMHISTTVGGDLTGLNGIANGTIAANQASAIIPVVSSTALGQQADFSASGSTTGNEGANAGAATTVAGGGGSPTASIQSGGLVISGGVAPTFAGNANAQPFTFVNGTTVSSGIYPGLFNTVQAGFQLNWTIPDGAIGTASTVLGFKALARQALHQANQELDLVLAQVRTDYSNMLAAKRQSELSRSELNAATEALRMAMLRLNAGAGTNLEVVKAKQRFVNAQMASAAIRLYSGQVQAQLLHDTGMVSVEALTK